MGLFLFSSSRSLFSPWLYATGAGGHCRLGALLRSSFLDSGPCERLRYPEAILNVMGKQKDPSLARLFLFGLIETEASRWAVCWGR